MHIAYTIIFITKGFKLIISQIINILKIKENNKIKKGNQIKKNNKDNKDDNINCNNANNKVILENKDYLYKNNRQIINLINNPPPKKIKKFNYSLNCINNDLNLNITNIDKSKSNINSKIELNLKYYINKDIPYQKNKNIKIKELNINNNIIKRTDNELNSLKYEEALKYDKRTYFQYYISLLKTNNLFIMIIILL